MQPVIEIKNLTVTLGGINIIENIGLTIEKGEIVAIIGPNGAGKSTLLKAILGLIPVNNQASIKVLGKNISSVRHSIGYVPQKFQFDMSFPITVKEFFEFSPPFGKGDSQKHNIIKHLSHFGMERVYNSRLGELSGGEIQRVLIVKATLHNPKILFLDEPSSGIDIAGEKKFYDIISHLHKKHNTTIVMVSHEVDIVYKYATNVLCLGHKNLVCDGSPHDVLNRETLENLYGESIGIHSHKHE